MPDGRARQVRGSKEEGETAKIEAVKVKTAEINNVGASSIGRGIIFVTSTTVVFLVPLGALMAPMLSGSTSTKFTPMILMAIEALHEMAVVVNRFNGGVFVRRRNMLWTVVWLMVAILSI